jgi:hypothetical protein
MFDIFGAEQQQPPPMPYLMYIGGGYYYRSTQAMSSLYRLCLT